jgi:hypothetical protein
MTFTHSNPTHGACATPSVSLHEQRRYGVAIYQFSDFLTSLSAEQADDEPLAQDQQLVEGVELADVFLRLHPEHAPFRDALAALVCNNYGVSKTKWSDVRSAIFGRTTAH